MEDNFRIVLEAILDKTSLSNIKSQLAKTDFDIKPTISTKEFVEAERDIQKHISGIAKDIQGTWQGIDTKSAIRLANEYFSLVENSAKKIARAQLQEEQNLQRQKDSFYKKNINYIDLEIQKREEQSHRFTAQLKAQMQEAQALAERSNAINGKIQNKGYEAEIAQVQGRYQQLGLTVDEVNQRLTALRTAYSKLQGATTADQRIAAEQEYQRVLQLTRNELTIARVDASEYISVLQQVKLSNKIQTWLKNNTAATKEARMQMQAYFDMLQGGRATKAQFQEISIGYDDINTSMRQMGRLGSSFAASVKAGIGTFTSWIGASTIVMKTLSEIRKGIQTITELDSALTNINYTMDVSSQQLKNIGNSSFEMAKNLKTSASNVLQALTLYANANETADSILEKTKTAVMLSNVSGISASDTADMLQGVSEQFEIEQTVEGLNHISDVIQNVSQNLAYDFTKGIGAINEAVSNSGSVAHMAGLSLEEYSAMVGKTIEVTRQAGSTVGNAYKTIFSRITKASAAEGTSEEDISKAEESLRAVNIEVRKNATEFRDVTDILSDLGKVWNDLSSVEQSNISFNLAGTRQTNILKSLLNGWQDYTDLVEKAYDAQGTTLENQEKYAESYKGHLQDLKATSESFWNNILNSGTLKVGIDSLTTILKLLDGISKTFGSLGTIGIGAGIFAGFKNFGRRRQMSPPTH